MVVELFATDWIFSLFSSVIPFDKMVREWMIFSVTFSLNSLSRDGLSFIDSY